MTHTALPSLPRSMHCRTLCTVLATLLLAVTALQALPSEAFPYGHTSAVTELTPAALPAFVQTHKPVVILFYAPWCGHCKQFHPEFERFAQAVKGAIRVGAINADQHSDVGGQFGIRGFPTIKYWKMGSKSLAAPEEYQSQRTANALQSFMMSTVGAEKVRTDVKTVEALEKTVLAAPKKKVAVLFSAKNKVPPIFSIVANSAKLQDLPFLFIEQKDGAETGVAAFFGITALPTIAVVETSDGKVGGSPAITATPFSGKGVAYEPIAKFFLAALEGETPLQNAGGAHVTALDETASPEKAAASAKRPRRALPVEPVPFRVDETLPHFCTPADDITRVNGGAAWCVLTLSGKLDLAAVRAAYHNEPFLFFDASQTGAGALDGALQTHINGLTLADCGVDAATNAEDGVVLIRKTKKDSARVVGFTGVDSTEALEAVMEKVSSGAVQTMQWKL